jgi:hypothetical protein
MEIAMKNLKASIVINPTVASVLHKELTQDEVDSGDPPTNFVLEVLTKVIVFSLISGWLLIFPMKLYADEASELGLCPQPREKTPKAPEEYIQKVNPFEKNSKNIKEGKLLYMVRAKTLQCKHCHGLKGDGRGEMASDSFPAPRNFTCTEMMKTIPDGQLFWVVVNGLPHTSMPSYDNLSDKQIWKLIVFIRSLAK